MSKIKCTSQVCINKECKHWNNQVIYRLRTEGYAVHPFVNCENVRTKYASTKKSNL